MGSIETFFASRVPKNDFYRTFRDHLTLDAVGPYNISVSRGSVTDDTPYCLQTLVYPLWAQKRISIASSMLKLTSIKNISQAQSV